MLNGEKEQKRSVHFFALMLALSLCMHTALCIFFYCIGVTILYVFNVASVVIYLLLLFLVSRVKQYGEMDAGTICRSGLYMYFCVTCA